MSRLFIRLPIIRALLPRVSAPILPISRLSRTSTSLTNTPRTNPRLFSHFPARLSPSPSPESSTNPSKNATVSQRLKNLIKNYGWYALGMYIVIGFVDFGVAFAGINVIGAEQVSQMAASIKNVVYGLIHSTPAEPGRDEMDHSSAGLGGKEGLYAMIALAYTIHKTLFLPVRVGLTAALTPKLVNWLRARGWAGGAGTRRAAEEIRDRFKKSRSRE
ncbi:hypothetical protein D9758_001852 [Tetrapyrgos nigripes]|uniref:DUF1279 domain-containing protein n=1 Tax=Tetrapyrgos nigripes TaxID=182062 RepID=A0A8H5GSX3_9AGAR|nr:hypothetical protein D9758_001852 [Tetrapyrgos nigripes]